MRDDKNLAGEEPGAAAADPRRWWALVLLCFTAFMIVLDASTVITALPTIRDELDVAEADLQWVITAYTLAMGGLMLLGGRLADLLGRRRVFLAGTAFFLVASAICGIAWSGGVLIAARALQGAAAAVVLPAALGILLGTFAEGPERNRAMAAWGMVASLGGITGFLVAGPLIEGPGWEWIYFMNLPMGVVSLVLAPVLLHESRDQRAIRRFDAGGAVTASAALMLLVYAISDVPEVGWWHGRTVGLVVLAGLLAGVFVAIERRSVSPLLPLRLFRSRSLVGGNIILLIGGIFMAFQVPLSLYAQQVLDYSAWEFGLAMFAVSIPALPTAWLASPAITRFGTRPVIVAGLALVGLGLALLARAPVDAGYVVDLMGPLSMVGVGMTGVFVGASIAALTDVPDDDSGVASAIEESGYQVAQPLGVALLSTVALTRTDQLLEGGSGPLEAQTGGFQAAYWVAVGFVGLALVAALVLLRPAKRVDGDGPGSEINDEPTTGALAAEETVVRI